MFGSNVMRTYAVTVHVDFPALSELVAYLKEQSANQAQIDLLAASVTALTKKLRDSNIELGTAVDAAKKPA